MSGVMTGLGTWREGTFVNGFITGAAFFLRTRMTLLCAMFVCIFACWAFAVYGPSKFGINMITGNIHRSQAELEQAAQLIELYHALGIFNGDHDKALLKAQHAIEDSELLEWAEHNLSGFKVEYDPDEPYERRCRILRHADTWADESLETHGPDLRDVLRQAMEWEEREQI